MPTDRRIPLGPWCAIVLIGGFCARTIPAAVAGEPSKPGLPGLTAPSGPKPDGNTLIRPSLIAESSALLPSGDNWIAVAMDIEPGWHTYWRNNGETGVPPTFTFTTPDWITVGDPVWPTPVRHELPSGGVDYVYEGRALVLFPVRVNSDERALRSDAEITAKIDWLVCDEICLPGTGTVSLTLPVAREATPSSEAPAFGAARSRVPSPTGFSKSFVAAVVGDTLAISAPGSTELEYFPYESDTLARPLDPFGDGMSTTGAIRFQFDRDPTDVSELSGVVRMRDASGVERFLEFRVPVKKAAGH